MKILVTGGAGFIGSHIVDALINEGHEVTSLDNESAASNVKFYKNSSARNWCFSILDNKLLLSSFERYKFDCIFHLAAEARIQPCIERPQDACEVNFLGTCNILQAAKQTGVKRVIYSSTSSLYGLRNVIPLREDMPKDCLNPYSVAKAAGEDLCKVYYKLWGLETISFRYFNVYGDRQPLKGNYAPVIGLFLRQRKEGKPLTVIGDGRQRRDFTHISDVVEANLLAMKSNNPQIYGEVFNIGTGRSYSILDVANMVGGEKTFLPPRLGETLETLADISKAQQKLGYSPKVVLEDWIRETT